MDYKIFETVLPEKKFFFDIQDLLSFLKNFNLFSFTILCNRCGGIIKVVIRKQSLNNRTFKKNYTCRSTKAFCRKFKIDF